VHAFRDFVRQLALHHAKLKVHYRYNEGVLIFMRRRLTDLGQIALQTFEGDWLPLILLLAISVTGLGLTWDYDFMDGKYYSFMAVTHGITVILFLIWIPFGKFFHIIQRPAQLGIAIYRKADAEGPQAVCPHTGQEFASQMRWITSRS
jgi:hypothetical protein